MKTAERKIQAAETQIIKQLLDTLFTELRKEINKREKVCAALDDMKYFNEFSHTLVVTDDLAAVKKIYSYHIAIIHHHLPECAMRIREKIQWL